MVEYFMGIDIGAANSKAVLITGDNHQILASSIIRSGVDFAEAAKSVHTNVLTMANISTDMVKFIISTGYGRKNVKFANDTKTEIYCHARGVHHYFPENCTIVDIGGQDNKVIEIESSGKQLGFKMNRKCAAGTGAFLEEIANRLGVPMESLDTLARKAEKNITLNSFCTVFASTEILARIREGESVQNMVKGAFNSIVLRIIELGLPSTTEGKLNIVMTGGVVQYNSYIAELLGIRLGVEIKVPPEPQSIGAFGAAIIAHESYSKTR